MKPVRKKPLRNSLETVLLRLDDTSALARIQTLQEIGGRRQAARLATVLRSDRQRLWMATAIAISCIGGASSIKPLTEIMLHGKHEGQREAAAYALSFLGIASSPSMQREMAQNFLMVLRDSSQSPSVRGQACEGLAYLLGDRRWRIYREAVDLLICSLNDAESQVRFWAAFALGSIGAREALPALRQLAACDKDARAVHGCWTVAEEAQDAIVFLECGVWPERMIKKSLLVEGE